MSKTEWDAPELAERYDRASDSQFGRGSLLVKELGIKAGDSVVDIGCGTGRLTMHIAAIAGPGGRVVGIDPSPYRISVAAGKLREQAFDNVHFSVGSAECPGNLPEGSFDYACYSSVFHWIEDKPAALRSTYRLLKPGGKVGITTGDRENPSGVKGIMKRLFARAPYAGQVKTEDDASQPVSKDELRTLLSSAGFTDIGINLRESKRYYSSPEEVFAFHEASAFGNFLRHVPESLRQQARQDLAEELEKHRTPSGIVLNNSTIYAIARKPA